MNPAKTERMLDEMVDDVCLMCEGWKRVFERRFREASSPEELDAWLRAAKLLCDYLVQDVRAAGESVAPQLESEFPSFTGRRVAGVLQKLDPNNFTH